MSRPLPIPGEECLRSIGGTRATRSVTGRLMIEFRQPVRDLHSSAENGDSSENRDSCAGHTAYPDASLTLVGSGSQLDALQRLASSLRFAT
jgi:hypothetical protein